ncbi:MAG TPA: DUF1775 domain-containing protein [Kofleriaceae bacterium]|jgi:uncharacterized protein YcnI|nr:DUF1775 domain-containing protein [Kofleriaceae bacterium]
MHALVRGGLAVAFLLVASTSALAHVGLASGPAQANKSQKITFSVGHGCETGAAHDTWKVRVAIPAGVTSVRALTSDFGKATVIKDNNDVVTAVEWVRNVDDLLDEDTNYYELSIRARVPDAAFTQLQFNITQTCRTPGVLGTEGEPVMWDQPPGATSGNPAPILTIVPARTSAGGWNKFTIPASAPVAADKLGVYFGDALIVWKGSSAYSANPNTAMQIANTAGVTPLASGLGAGEEVWVRY